MARCLCAVLVVSLLALPALAQDLLYDDGGSHVLDSLAPLLLGLALVLTLAASRQADAVAPRRTASASR